MKIFLDDIRNPPDDSWTVVRTAKDCIELLNSGVQIDHLSLDHDLGDESTMTGYDVTVWIERMCMENPDYIPPTVMSVHSANPVGRKNMLAAIESIRRIF